MTIIERAGRDLNRTLTLVVVAALIVAIALWWALARPTGMQLTGYFESTIGVYEGNDVRVLGVPVGSVTSVTPQGDVVKVEMQIEDGDVALPAGAQAAVVAPSLVSDRYVQLFPVYRGGPELPDGAVIPRERTAVPLELDDVVRNLNELNTALGPQGANADGALSQVLDVAAQNLQGNGRALGDTVRNLAALNETLSGSREDLFGTVTNLQQFTTALAANDQQVRQFNTQLAEVSGFLAAERADLGAAVEQLSVALGEVAAFVEDNRAVLKSNVDKLTAITDVLVAQRDALTEIVEVAPVGLGNLDNARNGASGTLDTRSNINELRNSPLVLVCELIRRSGTQQLPPVLDDTCNQLAAAQQGAAPLPDLADVITSAEHGQPPPMLLGPQGGGR